MSTTLSGVVVGEEDVGVGRPLVEGTPASHRNGDMGFSPIPVGMAILSDGKFPVTPYKSHHGAHRHKRFGWGMFPNFEGGAYVEHGFVGKPDPIMSISVKTDTIDYIAPFTSQSPYKFCLRRGGEGGGLDPIFGESVEFGGLV